MTQRDVVLRELRQAGSQGVTARDFIYKFGITRSAAIVWTLRHEDKLDIDTIDEGYMADGRRYTARYVLRGALEPPRPRPPAEAQLELPPATELALPCGCVRSADGRTWKARCLRHRP